MDECHDKAEDFPKQLTDDEGDSDEDENEEEMDEQSD